jgi:hypothetical protein
MGFSAGKKSRIPTQEYDEQQQRRMRDENDVRGMDNVNNFVNQLGLVVGQGTRGRGYTPGPYATEPAQPVPVPSQSPYWRTAGRTMAPTAPQNAPSFVPYQPTLVSPAGVGGAVPSQSPYYRTAGRTMAPGVANPVTGPYWRTAGRTIGQK